MTISKSMLAFFFLVTTAAIGSAACGGAPEDATGETQGAVQAGTSTATPATTTPPPAATTEALPHCATGEYPCHGHCIQEDLACCPTTMRSCGDYCVPMRQRCI